MTQAQKRTLINEELSKEFAKTVHELRNTYCKNFIVDTWLTGYEQWKSVAEKVNDFDKKVLFNGVLRFSPEGVFVYETHTDISQKLVKKEEYGKNYGRLFYDPKIIIAPFHASKTAPYSDSGFLSPDSQELRDYPPLKLLEDGTFELPSTARKEYEKLTDFVGKYHDEGQFNYYSGKREPLGRFRSWNETSPDNKRHYLAEMLGYIPGKLESYNHAKRWSLKMPE